MEPPGDDADVGGKASHRRTRRDTATSPTQFERAVPDGDAAIAARIRTGDRTAVREVFDTYFPLLTDYATSIMRSRDAAEDIVADIFVSIVEHPERVLPTQSLRAYLLWRIRHRALDVLRGQHRDDVRYHTLAQYRDAAVVATAPIMPDELLEAAEQGDLQARRMAQVLARLDASTRTIVLWRLRDELEYDEIALVLGISRAAVKMRLSRALSHIRSHLE